MSSTFLRAEDGDEVKFTEERTYRVSPDIFEAYAEVYVLSYYEVNEESTEKTLWDIDEAVAYQLIPE